MITLADVLRESTQSANTGTGGGNPNHAPAGSPTGGQFAKGSGAGSGSGLGTMPNQPMRTGARASSAPPGKGAIPPLPTASRTMKVGVSGDDVRNLQYAMGLLGFQVPQHGTFDHATADAVMQAQTKLGLPANGHASGAFLRKVQDAVRLSPCVKESLAVARIGRVLERWDPDLHPRDEDGKFSLANLIRGLAGAQPKGTDRPHGSVGTFRTRGGSRVHVALPSRAVRADDRIQDPADPKKLGVVAWVHGDTMRVNWDDGGHEVMYKGVVKDPLQDPGRTFQAQRGPVTPKADAAVGGPRLPQTLAERRMNAVASGRVDSATAKRLLSGESPSSIVDSRTPGGFQDREFERLTPGHRMVLDGLTQQERELYWARRGAGQDHATAITGVGRAVAAAKAEAPPKSSAVAKVARAKAAKPAFSASDVHAKLAAAQTREEGHAALQGLTMAQLRELDPVATRGAKGKADAVERVVGMHVGGRLAFDAIRGDRGGSFSAGDVFRRQNLPSPAVAKVAKAAPAKRAAKAAANFDPAEVADRIGAENRLSEQEIRARLEGLNVSQLRRVAGQLATKGSRPPAGSSADEWRDFLARDITTYRFHWR